MKVFTKLAIGGTAVLGAVAGLGASASAVSLPPSPVGSVFVLNLKNGGGLTITLNQNENGKPTKPVITSSTSTDPCVGGGQMPPPQGAVIYNRVCLLPPG